MRRPAAVRIALPLSFALLALSSVAHAASEWEPVAGGLGRDNDRVLLRVGGGTGLMRGDELSKLDPAKGLEAEVALRAFWSVSVTGSWAMDRADVNGQVVQLLDQRVRADGRSGNVTGRVETKRVRAGLRVDAYREKNWKFTPYFEGGVVFSQITITIDSVDGAPPAPVPAYDGTDRVLDISEYTNNEIGAMGRAGVEYQLAPSFGVDLAGNVEIIEFQAGKNSIYSFGGGFFYRF